MDEESEPDVYFEGQIGVSMRELIASIWNLTEVVGKLSKPPEPTISDVDLHAHDWRYVGVGECSRHNEDGWENMRGYIFHCTICVAFVFRDFYGKLHQDGDPGVSMGLDAT